MTTDQAAELLATYELTGSVSETARLIGKNKSNVSRALKKAAVAVAPEPPQLRASEKNRTGTNWADAWGQRESRGLEIVSERIESPDTDTWDIMRWTGIAADKRYREEHPEFQGRGGDAPVTIVPVQVVINNYEAI